MPPISDEEWESLRQALEENGWNVRATSRATGIPRSTIQHRIKVRMPEKASLHTEDGYVVKGRSTLYDMTTGEPKLEWVKTERDRERQEELARELIAGLLEGISPALPTPVCETALAQLLVLYAIGDLHLGMYAWADETGDDYDSSIAKANVMAAADALLAATPASDECLIANLGDFFHMDSSANATPRSNNRLDVDTRFPQVVRIGIAAMRYFIDGALKKHRIVRVRNVGGNHDPHAVIILIEALRGYYINEPRVIIECSPRPFWWYRFGSVLLGFAHGHGTKMEDMAGVLAVEAREAWGECEFRFVHSGHIHQRRVIEKMGTVVESHRTIAARDFWHAEMGYLSGREMQAIIYDKEFGEIGRSVASLKKIRSLQHVLA